MDYLLADENLIRINKDKVIICNPENPVGHEITVSEFTDMIFTADEIIELDFKNYLEFQKSISEIYCENKSN